MDSTLGRLTHDHGDIGWFTRAGGADTLARKLPLLGHTEVPCSPPGLRRDFAKDGLESSFSGTWGRRSGASEGGRQLRAALPPPLPRPGAAAIP